MLLSLKQITTINIDVVKTFKKHLKHTIQLFWIEWKMEIYLYNSSQIIKQLSFYDLIDFIIEAILTLGSLFYISKTFRTNEQQKIFAKSRHCTSDLNGKITEDLRIGIFPSQAT